MWIQGRIQVAALLLDEGKTSSSHNCNPQTVKRMRRKISGSHGLSIFGIAPLTEPWIRLVVNSELTVPVGSCPSGRCVARSTSTPIDFAFFLLFLCLAVCTQRRTFENVHSRCVKVCERCSARDNAKSAGVILRGSWVQLPDQQEFANIFAFNVCLFSLLT